MRRLVVRQADLFGRIARRLGAIGLLGGSSRHWLGSIGSTEIAVQFGNAVGEQSRQRRPGSPSVNKLPVQFYIVSLFSPIQSQCIIPNVY